MDTQENKYSPRFHGQPISIGTGPERYTLRVPIWFPENLDFPQLTSLSVGERISLNIKGRSTHLEKRDLFCILIASDFATVDEAKLFLDGIARGLLLLGLSKRLPIHFSADPVDLADPHNKRFRDAAAATAWEERSDGTVTDGGIFPTETAIIPEHRRIWEHPIYFGKRRMSLSVPELEKSLMSGVKHASNTSNVPLFVAFEHYSSAFAQYDHKTRCVMLTAVLEVLASRKSRGNLVTKLKKIVESYYSTGLPRPSVPQHHNSDELVEELYDVRGSIVHTGIIRSKLNRNGYRRLEEALTALDSLSTALLERECTT